MWIPLPAVPVCLSTREIVPNFGLVCGRDVHAFTSVRWTFEGFSQHGRARPLPPVQHRYRSPNPAENAKDPCLMALFLGVRVIRLREVPNAFSLGTTTQVFLARRRLRKYAPRRHRRVRYPYCQIILGFPGKLQLPYIRMISSHRYGESNRELRIQLTRCNAKIG